VPLSPNWRLAPDGKGVRIIPSTAKEAAKRVCKFEIVAKLEDHSPGTVADGDANCPFPDCGRIIEGQEVKRQALSHKMGEQLYTVVFKRRILKKTKTGKIREAWERGYRAPCAEDDNSHKIDAELAAKAEEWQALDILPTEAIPDGHKTHEPLRYGMTSWSDFFSSRQLLSHGINAEIFRTIAEEAKASGSYTELTKSALVYLTLTLDKLLNYNSRRCVWMTTREVVANSFNRHDFAF
jgi:adenine-specific DNA methylase